MSILDYHFRVLVENAPDYYYKGIQTDVADPDVVDPANPGLVHRDYVVEKTYDNVPTAVATLLNITSNVGSAIVNDIISILADQNDIKHVRVSVVRQDSDSALSILAEEKVLGNYSGTPDGFTLEIEIAEFSVAAAGTELVEV